MCATDDELPALPAKYNKANDFSLGQHYFLGMMD